jgi:signal transduction histidine kinase
MAGTPGPFDLNPFALGGLTQMMQHMETASRAWSGLNVPSSMLPTLDVGELDKRIADLKAIEQWLNLNVNMLRGTIQGLEIQRGTLAAVKAFTEAATVAPKAAEPRKSAAAKPVAPSASEQDAESFSYTVSHDLRAPVRVVEGFTKIVKEDYGRLLDRVGNDHLDRVLGAAARMNSMIDALLALSQLSSKPVSRQPVNLSQLAGFVVDDLRRQWPQHAVTVHIEPAMHVQGDPTLLRVMLENLLGNAWKYTSKCATPQVWFERCTDSAAPSFSVRDNGAGFDMRYAERLFGVFQRLHSASDFQGTGVGLASVRRIVQRHGGDVWAEAEVGRGANFYFSIGSPSA